jgi:hypothetical protein
MYLLNKYLLNFWITDTPGIVYNCQCIYCSLSTYSPEKAADGDYMRAE